MSDEIKQNWPESALPELREDLKDLLGEDGIDHPSGLINPISKSRMGGLLESLIRIGATEGKKRPNENAYALTTEILDNLFKKDQPKT